MRRDRGTTPLRRLAQSAAAARPVAWLSARLLHRIDGVSRTGSAACHLMGDTQTSETDGYGTRPELPMCGRRIPRQGPFSGSPVRTETTTSWIARVTAAA